MGKRLQGILIGVVIGALLAGGIAYAVTVIPPNDTDRYYACVSRTGVVRSGTMKLNVIPASCPKDTDTVRSWNAQGPVGPTGAQGVQGPQGPAGLLSCADELRIKNAAPTFELRPECVPPTPPVDPVTYWPFNDQLNPTADVAGGHDGTVVGAAFETSDLPPVVGDQAALQFNGTSDYVEVADPDGAGNLDGFTGLTLAAWVKPGRLDSPDGSQMIISKYHSASPTNSISYWLLLRGDAVEIFVSRVRVTNEARMTSTGVHLGIGAWAHVAGTWDGSQFRLYVNGAEVQGTTQVGGAFPTQMDDSSVPVNIGAAEAFGSGTRSAFFQGIVDEPRIYKQVLTPIQISALAG